MTPKDRVELCEGQGGSSQVFPETAVQRRGEHGGKIQLQSLAQLDWFWDMESFLNMGGLEVKSSIDMICVIHRHRFND